MNVLWVPSGCDVEMINMIRDFAFQNYKDWTLYIEAQSPEIEALIDLWIYDLNNL